MSTPLSPEEAATLAAALDPEAQARADAEREEQAARHRAEALLREMQHATNPQIELCKWWMRAGAAARRQFLEDAKASDPALFAEIMEGGTT
jgi:hypothetical protein